MKDESMLKTTDHTIIHEWARGRHGVPVLVNTYTLTPNKNKIAIAFGGLWQNANVEHISWHEWFSVFEEEKLALKYHKSEPLYELVSREDEMDLHLQAPGEANREKHINFVELEEHK
jgi:sucrose-6-phosphate hydrolase SacC (GH32 family)